MTTLLTGFDPFGNHALNPSQMVVERLARQDLPGLIGEQLPTEFIAAGTRIVDLIRKHRPARIICLGLAQGGEAIRLERIALNLNDSTLPDNAGYIPQGATIVPGAPLAYASTLPIETMREALLQHEIPAVISNHAGTFVCNHVFYLARHEVEMCGLHAPCGFIHLPGLASQKNKGLSLETMVEAIGYCLKFS